LREEVKERKKAKRLKVVVEWEGVVVKERLKVVVEWEWEGVVVVVKERKVVVEWEWEGVWGNAVGCRGIW